jgi:hypothetical protein
MTQKKHFVSLWKESLFLRKQLACEIAKNRRLFPLTKSQIDLGIGVANGRTFNWKQLDKTNYSDVAIFNALLRIKISSTQHSNATAE